MKKITIASIVLIVLIVGVWYLFGGGMRTHDREAQTHSSGTTGSMDHGSMVVESERAFLEGMIPHHQEAIDTASEVLARGGVTPEMRTLAQAIIDAQEREVTEMKTWYKEWYATTYEDTGIYEPMMRDLSGLSGAVLDRTFLEDMIVHHRGALSMAEQVQPYIEHDEIVAITQAIDETQTEEIALMERLLKELQ